MTFFNLTYVLLWLVVAFESLLLILILREIGVLYLGRREAFERDGPDTGKAFPRFRAVSTDGRERTLADVGADIRVIVFGAVSCSLCGPAMDKFGRWAARVPEVAAVMLVERSAKATELLPHLRDHPWAVWFIEEGSMFKEFGIRVSPYAVVVDGAGIVVAKGLVNHHGDIKRMIRNARTAASIPIPTRRRTAEPASAAPAV